MERGKKPITSSGKKKVIRRLVKNAKTGEIIKTEIVRIDSSGEMTVTSYPAGTEVPSLSSLQCSAVKKVSSKSIEDNSLLTLQRQKHPSKGNRPTHSEVSEALSVAIPARKSSDQTGKLSAMEVGPSVPVNVPGLEDLLEKEKDLHKLSELKLDKEQKAKGKSGEEESLEAALINIMKKKRQRDPKARRRGLVASTLTKKCSDDEQDQDTDYRGISKVKKDVEEEDESEKRRKEKHRRRKEKKHKEKPRVADDIEEYQGETGPLDLPEIESRKRPTTTDGLNETNAAEEIPVDALPKEMHASPIPDDEEESQVQPEAESGSDSGEEKKRKRRKHKHKKKKKKLKKQKKDQNESGKEELSDGIRRSRSPSRTRSLSSLSLSSISSAFSDSFDFAGMNFDPCEEGGFDMALMEYQHVKEQVLSGAFRGRGYDPFFRGRGAFRGFPSNRGFGMFPHWRAPAPMFHFFQADPNFIPPGFPGGPGGELALDKGRGRGVPANQGPWRGRGLRGRGIPPGFHRNYTEDDKGEALYFESDTSGSSSGGKRKKKKRHRRRSYSSSSYSSDSSRSRSRRRYRRRRRSSTYSSGSYSRSSYSRSRSNSRSRSRSSRSSYSRGSASYSRSRSHSRSSQFKSRSLSRGSPVGWGSGERRASPSYRAYDDDGFKPPVRCKDSDEEDVPWWAEFDKTYEAQKNEENREKLGETNQAADSDRTKSKGALPSVISTDEIDVIQCVMSLVEKAQAKQDEAMEAARGCLNSIINKILVKPSLPSLLPEEAKSFERLAHDCVQSMLDEICPNDPVSAARVCLNEIIDTVVEQEEEDKANEIASEMEKKITENKESRLFQCYLKAQKLTEEMKAGRPAKSYLDGSEKSQSRDSIANEDVHRTDKKPPRVRHQRRSRSKSRDRSRRRRRHSSSDSVTSTVSRGSPLPLVSKESLQQAQALLTLQQQQLQVAGLLGTGMPNLAGLTQAAALAAGLTPALLAQTGLKSSDLPNLMGEKPVEKESSKLAPKYEKDKESSKRDDLTRRLMQRMRDKKLKQEEAPSVFQTRKDKVGEGTDKIFTGSGLKSRKIEISSSFGKLWAKVDGSPKYDDGTNDFRGMNLEADVLDNEGESNQDQENKRSTWSAQQAKLKEEAKREMREQIERAERAKKEKMKEEILEQEKQKEIMRIREEVRSQIRKEIQEEIEKQRKTVLEDPDVREKLIQLEALRNQSGILSASNVSGNIQARDLPVTAPSSGPVMPVANLMKDNRWYQQQMKNKQDMQKWMESHGYFTSELDENTLKRLQMTYMQNWTPSQRQAYMQWYWQAKAYQEPVRFKQQQFPVVGPRANAMHQNHPDASVPNSLMESQRQGTEMIRFPMPEHHRMVPSSRQSRPFPPRLPYSVENVPGPRHGVPRGPSAYNENQFHDVSKAAQQQDMEEQSLHFDRYGARDSSAALQMQRPAHASGQQFVRTSQFNPQMKPGETQGMEQSPMGINSCDGGNQDNHPIHQYPPPCLEEEDKSGGKMLLHGEVTEQPPPPGEIEATATHGVNSSVVNVPMENDGATPKKKKKRKKKHKKRKYSSSDDAGEENDPEAEKAAILAKLENLIDVEDGEIASEGEAGGEVTTKKRKRAKKEKKKHRKRANESEDDIGSQPADPNGGQHIRVPPNMPGTMYGSSAPAGMPREMNIPPVYRGLPEHYANQEMSADHKFHHQDHRGAGEPQTLLYPRPHNPHHMGPSGDHRNRVPSPMPLGRPSDPIKYEPWQRKLQPRYQMEPAAAMDSQAKSRPLNPLFVPPGDRVTRQIDQDSIEIADGDVVAMMRMMDDEQRRRDQSPRQLGRPFRNDRKRRSAMSHRGRRKQRRGMPRKSYHDWDKPSDDGIIYCHSGSESSGWGSDTNLDFDTMLAKKQKEADGDRMPHRRSPVHGHDKSPGRTGWDRRALQRDSLISSMEKPQGIPVIGGGPRPIPTNVSLSRESRREMMGPPDFPVSRDPVKMPPMGYGQHSHFDQRREQTFVPPPIPMISHPIPRLGSHGMSPLPPPPSVMINPNAQRIPPMNYGKHRFGM